MPRHPIEDFVSETAFDNFKIPGLPNLGQLVKDHGMTAGLTMFAQHLQQWRTDFERVLVERVRIPAATTTETAAAEETPTAIAPPDTALSDQVAALAAQIQSLLSQLQAHANATSIHGTGDMATGTYEFAAAALPDDGSRLLCDGATHAIASYPDLAALLGTTYGGDGITTFGVPDFSDRFPLGQSGTRPAATTGDGKLVVDNLPEHSHLLAHSTVNTTDGTEPLADSDDYLAWAGCGDNAFGSNFTYYFAKSVGDAAPDIGRVGLTGQADPDPVFSPYLACWVYIRV